MNKVLTPEERDFFKAEMSSPIVRGSAIGGGDNYTEESHDGFRVKDHRATRLGTEEEVIAPTSEETKAEPVSADLPSDHILKTNPTMAKLVDGDPEMAAMLLHPWQIPSQKEEPVVVAQTVTPASDESDFRPVREKLGDFFNTTLYPWQVSAQTAEPEAAKEEPTVDMAALVEQIETGAARDFDPAEKPAAPTADDIIDLTDVIEEAPAPQTAQKVEPVEVVLSERDAIHETLVSGLENGKEENKYEATLDALCMLRLNKIVADESVDGSNISAAIAHFKEMQDGKIETPKDMPVSAKEMLARLVKLETQNISDVGFTKKYGEVDHVLCFLAVEAAEEELAEHKANLQMIARTESLRKHYGDDARMYDLAEGFKAKGIGEVASKIIKKYEADTVNELSDNADIIVTTVLSSHVGVCLQALLKEAMGKEGPHAIQERINYMVARSLDRPDFATKRIAPPTEPNTPKGIARHRTAVFLKRAFQNAAENLEEQYVSDQDYANLKEDLIVEAELMKKLAKDTTETSALVTMVADQLTDAYAAKMKAEQATAPEEDIIELTKEMIVKEGNPEKMRVSELVDAFNDIKNGTGGVKSSPLLVRMAKGAWNYTRATAGIAGWCIKGLWDMVAPSKKEKETETTPVRETTATKEQAMAASAFFNQTAAHG